MDSGRVCKQTFIRKESRGYEKKPECTRKEENTYEKVDARRKRRKGKNPCVEDVAGAGLQEVTEAELYVKSVWKVVMEVNVIRKGSLSKRAFLQGSMTRVEGIDLITRNSGY